MATDLDGIFNFGLKGNRDRKIFEKWCNDLNALNISKAKYHDNNGTLRTETGEWEYDISGYGGDDPDDDNECLPYQVNFNGPFMMQISIMDDISTIPTHHRLKILFEQPEFFNEFIIEVHNILSVFGASELIWLSSMGSASYSGIYQGQVWENVPFEKVKESLLDQIGEAINYSDAKKYDEEVSWEYKTLDKFVLDKF